MCSVSSIFRDACIKNDSEILIDFSQNILTVLNDAKVDFNVYNEQMISIPLTQLNIQRMVFYGILSTFHEKYINNPKSCGIDSIIPKNIIQNYMKDIDRNFRIEQDLYNDLSDDTKKYNCIWDVLPCVYDTCYKFLTTEIKRKDAIQKDYNRRLIILYGFSEKKDVRYDDMVKIYEKIGLISKLQKISVKDIVNYLNYRDMKISTIIRNKNHKYIFCTWNIGEQIEKLCFKFFSSNICCKCVRLEGGNIRICVMEHINGVEGKCSHHALIESFGIKLITHT